TALIGSIRQNLPSIGDLGGKERDDQLSAISPMACPRWLVLMGKIHPPRFIKLILLYANFDSSFSQKA
ncbi:MAG: hypothetical protein ACO3U3_08210, partial [Alphaproteobacteria bacterium]